jgi:DNA mismatch endonuclease (patch repair protein)
MTDIVSPEVRSRMMAGIRATNTKPELLFRRALRQHGYRGYRLHYRGIPGRPDVAFVGRRIAVFVDGAFWHGHPDYFTRGKSGPRWDRKIARNIERDHEVGVLLGQAGWSVLRVWDFEVLADARSVVRQLAPRLGPPSVPAQQMP